MMKPYRQQLKHFLVPILQMMQLAWQAQPLLFVALILLDIIQGLVPLASGDVKFSQHRRCVIEQDTFPGYLTVWEDNQIIDLCYNLHMVTEASHYIPLIVKRLKAINPAKVILFGSQVQGTVGAENDLDLLVVTNDERLPQSYHEKEQIYLEVARLLRDIRGAIPMDLIVHTRPMHARFIEMNSLFARELLQKGLLLYESHNTWMARQGQRWFAGRQPAFNPTRIDQHFYEQIQAILETDEDSDSPTQEKES